MGVISALKAVFSTGGAPGKEWHLLTKESQIETVLDASEQKPQLIYKHSHTCPVCIFAKREIESHFDTIHEKATLYFVNVLKSRPVSDAIAGILNVRHESPQVFMIYQRKVVWHTSHSAIKAEAILEELSKLKISARIL